MPLGIPLIAGPGPVAIADPLRQSPPSDLGQHVGAHRRASCVATLVILGCPARRHRGSQRGLGKLGMRVAIQVMGLILAAIGIEMIVSGIMDYVGWQSAALPA